MSPSFIPPIQFSCCSFFFQAEDGIRDGHVTGVQTCALPIYVLELPRIRHVLVPREDQVRAHLVKELEYVAGVEDDVALAAGAGDGDQVVVNDEDLEPFFSPRERVADEPVVLAPDPPVV